MIDGFVKIFVINFIIMKKNRVWLKFVNFNRIDKRFCVDIWYMLFECIWIIFWYVVCDLFLFLLLGEIDRLGRYSMVKVFEGMLDWVY